MNTAENFKFDSVKFVFSSDKVHVEYPREDGLMYAFPVNLSCWHLDWQVSSVAQILKLFSPIFSTVEHLAFKHEVHSQSSKKHNEVDRTEVA